MSADSVGPWTEVNGARGGFSLSAVNTHPRSSTRLRRFLPKPLQIERELPVVFDRKEYRVMATKEIQHQVFIDDKFPKIIVAVESCAQCLRQGLGFGGMDRMSQERSAGLWKSTELWNDFVEQAV